MFDLVTHGHSTAVSEVFRNAPDRAAAAAGGRANEDGSGPVFTVEHDDGVAAKEAIGAMPAGQSARVKVKRIVEGVPNWKTAVIMGAAGATVETIYIMAHRDGWFDASGDNASGVDVRVGGARQKIPKVQRKRPVVFVAWGHSRSPICRMISTYRGSDAMVLNGGYSAGCANSTA